MIEIKTVNDLNKFLQDNSNVCVDFYAPWCGPCRSMTPMLESLQQENTAVTFCKINIDESVEISNKFNITSIPTFMFFKNEKVTDKLVGMISKSKFTEWLNKNI